MMRRTSLLALLAATALLGGCGDGVVRRVSDPAVSVQQLTVKADGQWAVDLRLQNYSSIPMRFENASFAFNVGGEDAGTLAAQPGLTIGPESADVITVAFDPSANARLLLAGMLADGRGIGYRLDGTVSAAPADRGKARDYKTKRDSQLSPVPGLPGVLR